MSRETPKQMHEYWEDRGSDFFYYKWEVFYTVTSLPYYLKRREILLQKLEMIINKAIDESANSSIEINVLDFGCGDGFYSCWIKINFNDLNVFGCDLSLNMLELANKRAASQGLKITFKKSDSTVPFNEEFTIILVVAVLAHVFDYDNLVNILKTLKNHLLDNGYLLIFEFTSDQAVKGNLWYRRTQKQYEDCFNDAGLKMVAKETICFPFFRFINKYNIRLFRLAQKILRKSFNMKFPKNLNKSKAYIFSSKIFINISIVIDRFLKASEGNTIYVLKRK